MPSYSAGLLSLRCSQYVPLQLSGRFQALPPDEGREAGRRAQQGTEQSPERREQAEQDAGVTERGAVAAGEEDGAVAAGEEGGRQTQHCWSR